MDEYCRENNYCLGCENCLGGFQRLRYGMESSTPCYRGIFRRGVNESAVPLPMSPMDEGRRERFDNLRATGSGVNFRGDMPSNPVRRQLAMGGEPTNSAGVRDSLEGVPDLNP